MDMENLQGSLGLGVAPPLPSVSNRGIANPPMQCFPEGPSAVDVEITGPGKVEVIRGADETYNDVLTTQVTPANYVENAPIEVTWFNQGSQDIFLAWKMPIKAREAFPGPQYVIHSGIIPAGGSREERTHKGHIFRLSHSAIEGNKKSAVQQAHEDFESMWWGGFMLGNLLITLATLWPYLSSGVDLRFVCGDTSLPTRALSHVRMPADGI